MFLWKRKKNSDTQDSSQTIRTRTIEERLSAAKRARKASEKSLEDVERYVSNRHHKPTKKSKMDKQLEILKNSVVSVGSFMTMHLTKIGYSLYTTTN